MDRHDLAQRFVILGLETLLTKRFAQFMRRPEINRIDDAIARD